MRARTRYENSNQILHEDQTRWEKIIYIVDHTANSGLKIFVTRMLTRDLFAVANLPVGFSLRLRLFTYLLESALARNDKCRFLQIWLLDV